MDEETARWLTSEEAAPVLAVAAAEADPTSVAAARRIRRHTEPARAAAVLAQIALRRRAFAKFGSRAEHLFFSSDGLEQATRPAVAAWRAHRLRGLGASTVVDLGCGLGIDALAFADAGLRVTAVERDPVTARLAAANLRGRAEVIVGDAEAAWPQLAEPGRAVFADPARRTARGRSWRVEDLSPPWDFVLGLLDGSRPACVKLGPGVPHRLIPDRVDCSWVSEGGDLVEASLWAPETGTREALLLPAGVALATAPAGASVPIAVPEVGLVLYEPNPAVIRAGAVPALAAQLDASALASGIPYLVGRQPAAPTPFAEAFEVLELLDYSDRALRRWVRDHEVGVLEIKKRGIDVDPAALRRRLRPSGPNSVTLVLTPTTAGTRCLVVRRLSRS